MERDDTVERLAGGIARDFDLLLAAIIGHAENLTDCLSPGDPRAQQVLAIRRAAQQACDLTRQLLAFSRAQTLQPTTLDINAAVARARHGLQRLLGDGISLETQPCHGVWPVRADTEQLEQILYHLVVRARGAMPEGGSVVVSTKNVVIATGDARSDLPPGEYVELSMTDTGYPIPSAARSRLFEPFFPSERDQPSGLGLAMVFGVVAQSGGHLRVANPADQARGSRFSVFLPATREVSQPAPADGETVLVAGNDRSLQTFIANVLRRRGYRLLDAENAWDALTMAEAHGAPIDLLITTGINGPLVADAMRERHPSTRVLHVSASAADEDARNADAAATRAVLVPPFTPAALLRTVRALLA